MITIMITGCGRFSKELIDVLKENNDNEPVRIIGVDCDEGNILKTDIEKAYIVPKITDKEYINVLRNICIDEKVDIIFPFITAELPIISRHVDEFKTIGVKVSVSSPESIDIANNKCKIYELFGEYMPKQAIVKKASDVCKFISNFNSFNDTICFKLADSCGGNGFFICHEQKGKDIRLINKNGTPDYRTISEAFMLAEKSESPVIVQEYIKGTDYSVCALAEHGEVIQRLGFAAYKMSYGAAMNGEIKDNDKAYEITEKVIRELNLDGNVCLDFIIKDDECYFLEVNPRLNATLPFIAKAGLNLPWIRVKQLLGKPIPRRNEMQTLPIHYGLKMEKYYEARYF